jgi:uncharacterized protein DUF6463
MKRWIGRWLIAVSAIHTVFAVLVFGDVLALIAKRGLFNTVGTDPMMGAVVWFVLFGTVLFVCGLAVNELERLNPAQLPKSIGWSLLVMAILGVVLMPASGFWLIFPPALVVLIRRSNEKFATTET